MAILSLFIHELSHILIYVWISKKHNYKGEILLTLSIFGGICSINYHFFKRREKILLFLSGIIGTTILLILTHRNLYFYKYIRGALIRAEKRNIQTEASLMDCRASKIAELDQYYGKLKEEGFEYQGKHFKADDEAYTNFLGTAILMNDATLAANSLPLTWYTRNGEEGVITLTTVEEVLAFIAVGALVCKNIKDKYYAQKKQIEECQSIAELEQINFNNKETMTEEV